VVVGAHGRDGLRIAHTFQATGALLVENGVLAAIGKDELRAGVLTAVRHGGGIDPLVGFRPGARQGVEVEQHVGTSRARGEVRRAMHRIGPAVDRYVARAYQGDLRPGMEHKQKGNGQQGVSDGLHRSVDFMGCKPKTGLA